MTLFEPTESKIFKTRGPLDPVNDTAICVPRPELDKLLRAAQATTVDAYLAILSSRQTGKTTLLYQLRHRLRPRGYGVALIDLAVVRDQPEEQLYRFVASGIRSELEPILPRTDKRDLPPLPTNPLEFRKFALEIARQARTPRIAVLIDEVEAVPEELSDAFFGTIRNIFSSRRKEDEVAFEKFLFVLSGAKELHRLSSGPNSPLNIAERIYLQDFNTNGVRQLVEQLGHAGIPTPPEMVSWVCAQTNGHPYLTQKLLATIEQTHPAAVTLEVVEQAANEILRSDDHLEKMIFQIDSESSMRDQLEKIVKGEPVTFSRLNSALARLELAGTIRDERQCVIRNEIYRKAFRAHFGISDAKPPRQIPWLRVAVAIFTILLFAINVPFLYNYATNILGANRLVNTGFAPADMSARAVVRYNPVLRANDAAPTVISIQLEQVREPMLVSFRADDPDIELKTPEELRLDQNNPRGEFRIMLNQKPLPYDPLHPATEHRQVHLIFRPAENAQASHSYAADFVIDYYSAAVITAGVSLASLIAFLAGVWGNIQRFRDIATFIGKFGKKPQ